MNLNGISIYLCCMQYSNIEINFCSKYQISYTAYVSLFPVEEGSGFLIPSASQLFESSSQIIIIIAATRMHRSLVNFASGFSEVYDTFQFLSFFPAQCSRYRFRPHGSPKVSNPTSSKTKRTDIPSNALDRVEVAIHTAIERHSTSSTKVDEG